MKPARRLLRLASAWFDAQMVSRVFEPLLADGAHEVDHARGLARAIATMRLHASFATTCALGYPRQVARELPFGLTTSTWWIVELFTAAGALLALIPFASTWRAPAALLLPGAIAVTLPFSILPAAILIAARTHEPWQARAALVRVAAMSVVVTALLTGWVVPSSNRAWRQHVWSGEMGRTGPAARGVRELSITELLTGKEPDVSGPARETRRMQIAQRVSVTLLPVTMLALGLSLARRRARRPWLRAIACWVLGVGALFAMQGLTFGLVGRYSASAAALASAVPHVMLFLTAALARTRREHEPAPL